MSDKTQLPLSDDECDQVSGGRRDVVTTLAIGEETGPTTPIFTTLAIGEESGCWPPLRKLEAWLHI